ncbi:hypothetical protein HDV05_003474 [Chytridiales sp. JEL 0842]|nr:hypothetical protein HDV05_003474 [Chytridiales sp. JEL 0842]
MFKQQPQPPISIQFILDRPYIDVPPPKLSTSISSSTRLISGILRIIIPSQQAPLKADRIQVDLYGLYNGVRDSMRCIQNVAISTGDFDQRSSSGSTTASSVESNQVGEMLVDKSFVLWQPRDSLEKDAGISAGTHDFPFSIPIPLHILPTYSIKVTPLTHPLANAVSTGAASYVPSYKNQQLSSSFPSSGASNRNEIVRAVCADSQKFFFEFDDISVIVTITISYFACIFFVVVSVNFADREMPVNGEFNVILTIPRMAFLQDSKAKVSMVILDGAQLVSRITGIQCILTETSAYRASRFTSGVDMQSNNAVGVSRPGPSPTPVGTMFHFQVPLSGSNSSINSHPQSNKPPHTSSPPQSTSAIAPLFSEANPLEFYMDLATSQPDLSTSSLEVTHALMVRIEYRSTSHYTSWPPTPTSRSKKCANNAGAGGVKRFMFDEHANIAYPSSNFLNNKRRPQQATDAPDEEISPRNSPEISHIEPQTTHQAHITVPIRIVNASNADDEVFAYVQKSSQRTLNNAAGSVFSGRSGSAFSRGTTARPGTHLSAPSPTATLDFLPPFPNTAGASIPSSVSPTTLGDEAEEGAETPYVVVVGYTPTPSSKDEDPALEDQLKMQVGDHVIVSEVFEDGWAVGTNLNSSVAGLFPVGVVKFDKPLKGLGALKEEEGKKVNEETTSRFKVSDMLQAVETPKLGSLMVPAVGFQPATPRLVSATALRPPPPALPPQSAPHASSMTVTSDPYLASFNGSYTASVHASQQHLPTPPFSSPTRPSTTNTSSTFSDNQQLKEQKKVLEMRLQEMERMMEQMRESLKVVEGLEGGGAV